MTAGVFVVKPAKLFRLECCVKLPNLPKYVLNCLLLFIMNANFPINSISLKSNDLLQAIFIFSPIVILLLFNN